MRKDKVHVLFFCTHGYAAKTIKAYERIFLRKVRFNHVGIAVHTSMLGTRGCLPDDEFVVLESTLSGPINDGIYDVCNEVTWGVQMRRLSDLISTYKASGCLIARSECKEVDREVLAATFKAMQNIKYETNPLNLLSIHAPFLRMESNRMFCSQFVASFLHRIGINTRAIDARFVSPNNIIQLLELKEPIYLWEP